ncbi:MAG: trypsin-like peptidase domain-containing protein [Rhizobacter sp.]|nr:trypsin-like peptidase domain-containing protein [Bacteriovorax sp.]
MRQILFLCLFSSTFLTSFVEAKLPVLNPGIDAIYGADDRELITSGSNHQIKKLADSVALIVSIDVLDIGFLRTIIKAATLKENVNMCVTENFVTRPSVSGCTGFLVSPDVIATAGHCFQNEEDCATKKIIFDVDSHNQTRNGYVVLSHNVYSCKEVLKSESNDDHDYALIRMERASKRLPLKLNKSGLKISDDASVFMIGHPLGLPLMLSKSAPVSDNRGVSIFKTALDSFEGNSGSPVFNANTFEVEGILVNGQEDFVLDSNGECYRNKRYDDGVAGGEGVTRISDPLPFIK